MASEGLPTCALTALRACESFLTVECEMISADCRPTLSRLRARWRDGSLIGPNFVATLTPCACGPVLCLDLCRQRYPTHQVMGYRGQEYDCRGFGEPSYSELGHPVLTYLRVRPFGRGTPVLVDGLSLLGRHALSPPHHRRAILIAGLVPAPPRVCSVAVAPAHTP